MPGIQKTNGDLQRKNKMELKIAQINAQRSAAVAADLNKYMREKNLDILCIQEPYVYRNRVRGYSSPGLKVIQPNTCLPWVAVVVREDGVQTFHLLHEETEHILSVHIVTNSGSFYLINVYCQFSRPIEPFLKKLECIKNKVGGDNMVLVMDANARSELWHSRETDERGRLMEEFLMTNDLFVVNEAHNPPTFQSANGESNIDITVVGGSLLNRIRNWRVRLDCAISDHNLITFGLSWTQELQRALHVQEAYNIKKANWEKFETSAKIEFNSVILRSILDAECDEAVDIFNNSLKRVCRSSIPKAKRGIRTVPWWSKELQDLRIEAGKAKKQLWRARKLNLVDFCTQYEATYKKARNRYCCEIKRRKRDTWRNFVSEEGNKDPWGIVYKIARDKIKTPESVCSLVSASGEYTASWQSTMKELLGKAVPRDVRVTETAEHKEIREVNEAYANFNIEEPITMMEIGNAVKRLKNNKTPGLDGFKNEMVKALWKCSPEVISGLLNNCLANACFPDCWKVANVRFILKSRDKDKSRIGSYRPISLLSSMGKLYERVVVDRIQRQYREENLESEVQFGFRARKSTEDAFLHFRRGVESSERKYVVALFIDIEGAFDNLWWPTIVARLIKANCSTKLMDIVKSYFNNRIVKVGTKYEELSCKMERGCPQGSIIGPAAWCWVMDDLLKQYETQFDEEEAEIIAYADDLVILVKANSRRGIEVSGSRALSILVDWCGLHKLKISAEKTKGMTIKGKFDKGRPPTLRVEENKISFVSEIRYLGLIIDDKLNFVQHTKHLRNKLVSFTMSIRRIAREQWGIKGRIVDILYDAVVVPIASYGSIGWYDKVGQALIQRHLSAAQRAILLVQTKACRTVSTVAMQVLAGKLPLDLEIVRCGLRSKIRRNQFVNWRGYRYGDLEEIDVRMEEAKIDKEVMAEWQIRWETEGRGRDTYRFIRKVDFVRERKWFRPCRELVYLITGYGPIRATLYRRGLEEEKDCAECAVEETVEHMLYDCPIYAEDRFAGLIGGRGREEELISEEANFRRLTKYAKSVFRRRETYLARGLELTAVSA